MKSLREAVEVIFNKNKYLRGLDGRHIHVRSSHAALNTLLQGAGAAICKAWIVETDRLMSSSLKHGWDGDYVFLLWSHDEVQIACRTPLVAALAATAAQKAIENVELTFAFRVPLDVSGKTGLNWAETH